MLLAQAAPDDDDAAVGVAGVDHELLAVVDAVLGVVAGGHRVIEGGFEDGRAHRPTTIQLTKTCEVLVRVAHTVRPEAVTEVVLTPVTCDPGVDVVAVA